MIFGQSGGGSKTSRSRDALGQGRFIAPGFERLTLAADHARTGHQAGRDSAPKLDISKSNIADIQKFPGSRS